MSLFIRFCIALISLQFTPTFGNNAPNFESKVDARFLYANSPITRSFQGNRVLGLKQIKLDLQYLSNAGSELNISLRPDTFIRKAHNAVFDTRLGQTYSAKKPPFMLNEYNLTIHPDQSLEVSFGVYSKLYEPLSSYPEIIQFGLRPLLHQNFISLNMRKSWTMDNNLPFASPITIKLDQWILGRNDERGENLIIDDPYNQSTKDKNRAYAPVGGQNLGLMTRMSLSNNKGWLSGFMIGYHDNRKEIEKNEQFLFNVFHQQAFIFLNRELTLTGVFDLDWQLWPKQNSFQLHSALTCKAHIFSDFQLLLGLHAGQYKKFYSLAQSARRASGWQTDLGLSKKLFDIDFTLLWASENRRTQDEFGDYYFENDTKGDALWVHRLALELAYII